MKNEVDKADVLTMGYGLSQLNPVQARALVKNLPKFIKKNGFAIITDYCYDN